MKITFFIGSMRRGGAERVISILANHYAENGWDVDIALLLDTAVQYPLHERIQIVDLNTGCGSYVKSLPRWLASIRAYVKRRKPDRVVSFIGRINMLVLTATLGLHVPVIVSERNDPKHDGRGRLIQFYCNRIYKRAAAVVFQTRYEQSCFSGGLKQGVVIPNPIHTAVSPRQVERPEIVTAGRLTPQKNQKMLIDAFEKVHKSHPEFTLKIYGEGSLRNVLQSRIDAYGLSESAKLCGNVLDVHEQIAGAAAFVLCSEFEGLSNALIEAMMLGIPCISTNYSGADEIVQDGVNGLLVPKGDVEALANAMERLLQESDFCAACVKNGLKTTDSYQKEIVLKAWESIIGGKEIGLDE